MAPAPAVTAVPFAPPPPPSTRPLTDTEADHGWAADRVGLGSLLPLALVAAAAPRPQASAASALSGGALRPPPPILPSIAAAATPGPRFPYPPPYTRIRGRWPLGPPLGGLLLAPLWRHDLFCAVCRRRRHELHGHAGGDCAAAAVTDALDARRATAATAIPAVDARGRQPSDAATPASAAHKAACAPPAAATARC